VNFSETLVTSTGTHSSNIQKITIKIFNFMKTSSVVRSFFFVYICLCLISYSFGEYIHQCKTEYSMKYAGMCCVNGVHHKHLQPELMV